MMHPSGRDWGEGAPSNTSEQGRVVPSVLSDQSSSAPRPAPPFALLPLLTHPVLSSHVAPALKGDGGSSSRMRASEKMCYAVDFPAKKLTCNPASIFRSEPISSTLFPLLSSMLQSRRHRCVKMPSYSTRPHQSPPTLTAKKHTVLSTPPHFSRTGISQILEGQGRRNYSGVPMRC